MRKRNQLLVFGVAAVAVWQLGGCANLLPTIPFPVLLGNSAEFDVVSGTPTAKTINTTFNNDSGVSIGSGNLQIDPSMITVTPDQSKTLQAIPETCGDACDQAGLSDELCTAVCNAGSVVVRVWVGLENEADPMATGDEYGPYEVTLDGEANPVSVSPEEVELQAKTMQAINAGAATITIEITSPYTGTVTLEGITVNAGL